MKAQRLFRILGLVDADLIEDAATPIPRRPAWRRWSTTAACIAVLMLCGGYLTFITTFQGCGASGGNSASTSGAPAETSPSAAAGTASDGATRFLS